MTSRLTAARATVLSLWTAFAAGCADIEEIEPETIDVRRIGSSVEVRRARGAQEVFRLDAAAGERVLVTAASSAGAVSIDAAATPPGTAISATVTVETAAGQAESLDVLNDLVTLGDTTYRLYEWQERNHVARSLAGGPIGAALRELAPYRTAVEAHLVEARPAFVAVGLFQEWPEGVEPEWPVFSDPRDIDPPGHLEGDVIGLGMTCSPSIRCPSSAPFCVSVDHEVELGSCTRACALDADCEVEGGVGRCTLPVIDIPDVPDIVLGCRVECAEGACPGLLECLPESATCEAVQPD